jgi:lipopolysaccharide export system permease protein
LFALSGEAVLIIGFTLGRYLSARFVNMVAAVFLTIIALVYLIDFVEMLRRAGNIPQASAASIAGLSLLRIPAVAEQIFPFAVLFGAMAAFVNLTRRLELVVARASGISVWQFMFPPLLITFLAGVFSVALFNPLSADMKMKAERIEARLFGTASNPDKSVWFRQRSVDGQALIRAMQASDSGAKLTGVTVYLYDADNRFLERIEAKDATLQPGAWKLDAGRVITSLEEPRDFDTYLLATDVTQDEVARSFSSAESVPFWELPKVRDRTEGAGLDATGYRLQYQTLLARPLLLVAMVLIAAAFSLRFFRFGGVTRMVASGVGAGFILYVATKVVADLGSTGLLSAPVAAWSPALVGSLLGALALLHLEDG